MDDAPDARPVRGLEGNVRKSHARLIASFSDRDARTAHLPGHVLHLGQAVLHAQLRFLVVHVQARLEVEARDRGRVDVDHAPQRMLREDMAAAGIAPLARDLVRLAERADLVLALGYAHCFGLPQRECVDGAGRPATARLAMAITHRGGLAFHRELHRSAEATSLVNRHVPSPSLWVRSAWTESVPGFP